MIDPKVRAIYHLMFNKESLIHDPPSGVDCLAPLVNLPLGEEVSAKIIDYLAIYYDLNDSFYRAELIKSILEKLLKELKNDRS